MATKKSVTERDLQEFARCPLRTVGQRAYEDSPELEAANVALKWLILETFHGSSKSLHEIRARIEESDRRPKVVNNAARIARRLSELMDRMEILLPVTSYRLNFARMEVTGEYGVICGQNRRFEPMIIRLRDNVPLKYPDLISAARLLHFNVYEPSSKPAVLNYSILQDRHWVEELSEDIMRHQLGNLTANIADQRLFPIAGDHCKTCKTEACLDAAL